MKMIVTDPQVLTPTEFKNAPRLQTSWLTPMERKALNWFTRHMPAWVTSDHLTLLGFVAMLVAGACYAMARWWSPALLIVNLLLVVNWFGDSLDGTLARARNKQRPRYGFYVDHIVDAFGILAILCGLGLSGYMSWTVAMAFLVTYFILSIDVYLATYTIGTFRMSFYKLGPTELRVLLAIGNLAAFLHPKTRVLGSERLFFDVGAGVAIIALAVVIIVSVTRNIVTLYRAERI
jgi:archaetidylinositol phosphate synthase